MLNLLSIFGELCGSDWVHASVSVVHTNRRVMEKWRLQTVVLVTCCVVWWGTTHASGMSSFLISNSHTTDHLIGLLVKLHFLLFNFITHLPRLIWHHCRQPSVLELRARSGQLKLRPSMSRCESKLSRIILCIRGEPMYTVRELFSMWVILCGFI